MLKKINYISVCKYLAIIAVLLLAAYLRLYRISEYLTFLGDEGRDVLVVKKMIVDHDFTLLGPTTSVGGFYLGPFYYYLMAPFLWLWNLDPTGPAVMVALLGVMTVFLLIYISQKLYSFNIALFMGLLYALSPVVIGQSRSSWNPNVVPFFSALLIIYLWNITYKDKKINFVIIGLILGLGIQLHYLFLFLYIGVFLWLLILKFIFKKRLILRDIILIFVGWFVGIFPLILFELRHNFLNIKLILTFLKEGKETGFSGSNFIINIWDVFYRSFGRLIFRQPDKNVFRSLPVNQIVFWSWSTSIIAILSFTYSLFKLTIYFRKYKDVQKNFDQNSKMMGLLLIIILFCTSIILFGFYKREIYDYYLGIIFIVPFLLFGFFLNGVSINIISKLFIIVLLAVLSYFNWEGRPFKFVPNNQLKQAKNIARVAFDASGGNPFNFALEAPLNSDHAYRYFFEIWGNPPITIENYQKDPDRKTVTDQLIIICENPGCQPLGDPLWEIAGFGRAEIAGKWDVPFATIYKMKHYENK